jgi:hypothetical protein
MKEACTRFDGRRGSLPYKNGQLLIGRRFRAADEASHGTRARDTGYAAYNRLLVPGFFACVGPSVLWNTASAFSAAA